MSSDENDPVEYRRQEQVAETVARVLREEVPVRDDWRAGVLRDLASLAPPRAHRLVLTTGRGRRWEFRPLTAIAAGAMCVVLGAAATAVLLKRSEGPAAASAVAVRGNAAPSREQAPRSTVRFVLVAPYASRVSLVGDFNRWNPQAMPMRRSSDGRTWTLEVSLAPGRHLYSFFIDGDLAPDPAAPRAGDDDFGVPSSVILVSGGRT